jgi:hypothetical protein
MLRKACLISLALFIIPCISHAETKTIFADHKFVMGDNDSRNDARRMCFIEAKRKVLEKAGTYIESHTQVENYKLTKDEINSYSAALLEVETVKEEWKLVGENMAVFMTVKAEVDNSYIEKKISEIGKDESLQVNFKAHQSRLNELEQKFISLQTLLLKADSSTALSLLLKRNETVESISIENEAIKKNILSKRTRDDKRSNILRSRSKIIRSILNYVELGMTPEEVRGIIVAITNDNSFKKLDRNSMIKRSNDNLPEWLLNSYCKDKYIWHKLLFDFDDDKIIKEKTLKEIIYYRSPTGGFPLKGGNGKDKPFNWSILNPEMTKGTPLSKDRIRKHTVELYQYIWGE